MIDWVYFSNKTSVFRHAGIIQGYKQLLSYQGIQQRRG